MGRRVIFGPFRVGPTERGERSHVEGQRPRVHLRIGAASGRGAILEFGDALGEEPFEPPFQEVLVFGPVGDVDRRATQEIAARSGGGRPAKRLPGSPERTIEFLARRVVGDEKFGDGEVARPIGGDQLPLTRGQLGCGCRHGFFQVYAAWRIGHRAIPAGPRLDTLPQRSCFVPDERVGVKRFFTCRRFFSIQIGLQNDDRL